MAKLRCVIQKSDVLLHLMRNLRSPAEQATFERLAMVDQVELVSATEPERLAAEIETADILLTENRPLPPGLLGRAKRLRLIQNGGLRHGALDVEAARRAGVAVAAFALPGDIGVAEHALMLMMAVGRKLLASDRSARRGEWGYPLALRTASDPVPYLYRKTLGIVGLGEVGAHVARRARSLGMTIIYHNRRRLSGHEEHELAADYRALPQLLAEADIVDIHVTEGPDAMGMIGSRELAMMKSGAMLINTARGGIVDQAALVETLAAGRIGGAGLDVFVEEPLPPGHPLAQLDNVILTPHVAGRGAVWDTIAAVFANVGHLLRGEPLQDVVNADERPRVS